MNEISKIDRATDIEAVKKEMQDRIFFCSTSAKVRFDFD